MGINSLVDRPTADASPIIEKRKVTRLGKSDSAVRSREHLTPDEVDRLIHAAGAVGRYAHRDATLMLLAYRHGLRVSELVSLRWDAVDIGAATLHVSRLKHGTPSTHPLGTSEVMALRVMQGKSIRTGFVFVPERGGPMTADGVRKIVGRAGQNAELGFPVHPYMLRHACGYKLANDGQDTRAIQGYLGHKSIQHTVRYTELAPGRFAGFWQD
jgi:type 1 fimbriae regulatory protein FimB/type 1 fimbriae regulatory protein FimE